jgi:hypothetical protein
MKLGRHRREPERVHLEDGGRGDEVADRSVEYGFSPKVVDAWWMDENEVLFRQVETSDDKVESAGDT